MHDILRASSHTITGIVCASLSQCLPVNIRRLNVYFINRADIDVRYEFLSEFINGPYIAITLRRMDFSFMIGLD